MQVIYDSNRPKGVGSLMRVGDFESFENGFVGKSILWGLATFGALSVFEGTRGFAKMGGYIAAGVTVFRSTLGAFKL